MTKDWAFTSETGSGTMTAWVASRIRWAKYGGAPLPRDDYEFWSTHDVGSRKRVKHVQKKKTVPHFAYYDGTVPSAGDGGESLAHEFYKKSIARLTKTQLQLTNGHYDTRPLRLKNGNYDIRITHAETEKTVHLSEDQYYRPDVYFRFECDDGLSTKWSGELYIEVWHMHPVPAEKIKNLKAHRVPVIQVIVPKVFIYPHDGGTTTEDREEKYITGMVGQLEKYMSGFVLSDPNSVEYLEKQVLDLAGQIEEHENLAIKQAKDIDDLQGTIVTMEDDAQSLRAERDALSLKLSVLRDGHASAVIELRQKAIHEEEKMRGLKDEIMGLKNERTDLHDALKDRTIALAVASGLALLGMFLAVQKLMGIIGA